MNADDIEEYKALTSVLLAYYHFHKWQFEQIIKPKRIKYNSLTSKQQELIPWFPSYIDQLIHCVNKNKEFTQLVATTVAIGFGVSENPETWYEASYQDYDKVRSLLLQVTREWSKEGNQERSLSFDRILQELNDLFPDQQKRQHIKVLVPGCGTGKLVLQLISNGYWCQGNEFSYHMLIMSNFILNHCKTYYEIYPFIHKSSNVKSREYQTRSVTIPEEFVDFNELMNTNPSIAYYDLMSMTAGSFPDIYGPPHIHAPGSITGITDDFRLENKHKFSVIVTCFFIDTASNIIDYLETITYSLKPQGIWINLGPLLWHFEGDNNTTHIFNENQDPIALTLNGLELSRDDLLQMIEKFNFTVQKHHQIPSKYSADPNALGYFMYDCQYWVCRKEQ